MQDLLNELTLVTVTYNSAEVLPAHIASLKETSSKAMPRWIVVDNASTDATDAIVSANSDCVEMLKSLTNIGFGSACNLGIEASHTRYVMVLNPDTQLSEAAINQLLTELKERGAAIAGPALAPEKDQSVINVPWLVGAVLLFDTQLMNRVGYFDEQFFLYEEDVDICKCANDAGLQVVHCRNVSIPHVGGGSTVRTKTVNEIVHFHKGRSYVLYARKHGLSDEHIQTYLNKNKKRRLIALFSFGGRRYRRANAKIKGAMSVLGT
ncbi:MAG: glycosyltransferase family 2 protein [Zhongshania sp.]|jgi:N-acetylglucosaminyl-diphospho-decaprenol L-rhamnosyltransferase|nr:glycosyltransferase family 2 protein [Zhongshania sp.]